MLNVTQGEIISKTAIPLCDIAALINDDNCFLEPENERATNEHPRLIASVQSQGGVVDTVETGSNGKVIINDYVNGDYTFKAYNNEEQADDDQIIQFF